MPSYSPIRFNVVEGADASLSCILFHSSIKRVLLHIFKIASIIFQLIYKKGWWNVKDIEISFYPIIVPKHGVYA